ncbi:hypothetical protein FOZ60_006434 [Perkinsus olseni]|uniref:Uncharacterized protein n=1 Tax=Perkinsus olseni TaxID=32597 RepID=A0A7J6PFB8_PEROL|nr:hypothetical protein FOZ60_006434 [Perkinsus olseni]
MKKSLGTEDNNVTNDETLEYSLYQPDSNKHKAQYDMKYRSIYATNIAGEWLYSCNVSQTTDIPLVVSDYDDDVLYY